MDRTARNSAAHGAGDGPALRPRVRVDETGRIEPAVELARNETAVLHHLQRYRREADDLALAFIDFARHRLRSLIGVQLLLRVPSWNCCMTMAVKRLSCRKQLTVSSILFNKKDSGNDLLWV